MKSRLALVVACCLALSACSLSMPKIWPFYKKPKPGPDAVNELTLVNADGSPASYPQYWVRNTLVIDLSGVSGQGSVAARLPDESTWPVRVALRVAPGSVGQFDIQGEERNVLPVAPEGTKPVDIELATSLYTPKTAAIYIAWAPMAAIVESAPEEPATPEFVSPTVAPPASQPAAEEPAPTASDIVPPAEVAPAQSPPPGTR